MNGEGGARELGGSSVGGGEGDLWVAHALLCFRLKGGYERGCRYKSQAGSDPRLFFLNNRISVVINLLGV